LSLRVGNIDVELIEFNIHSDDGVVLWLPHNTLLLAGDTLEDTVTYVAEPENLTWHLPELERLASLGATHILPNHGCPHRIAAGGYKAGLIPATVRYVRALLAMKTDASLRQIALRDLLAVDLEDNTLVYLEDYEAVHERNVERILSC
jgi:glyoxylase-like metal-dependent hydrolase (beta-lactamase superfamily II)